MSEQFAFLIAVSIHGSIFFILFLVWFFTLRKSAVGARSPLVRSKVLIEQKLVLEAISACNAEKDLHSLLTSIGKHASEITGYVEWILWLRKEGTSFAVAALDLEINPEAQEALTRSSDPDLFSWVIQNASPARMGGFVNELAATDRMGQTLMRLSNGLMIPFIDGARVIGFAIVGGRRQTREKRSNQCLSLFGASAAILISNRRLHEQERLLRERQERAEKLASLGKLAAGLAHEIRNPLGFMKVSVQHLQSKYEFTGEDRETADDIVDEINRVNMRIEEMLVL
ncbi:MAG TPA: histidine kinase dimerization/phospho-acceptor domain-containing protein, partial [Acidobacteriota bacterium]|nr:histidine kinase dimerization/phospho-acceptor domain-containing protein [Acidobacteriota bacterium]